MEKLIPFTISDLAKITNYRNGEVKFGEKMIVIPKDTEVVPFIKKSEAKYVLVGIPEDVGVKANFGRSGAASAWESALKSIVNIQHNKYCKGNQLLVLGQVDVTEEQNLAKSLDVNNASDRKQLNLLVEKIDKEVSHIIFNIIKAGKIPIIIGGGHNNAYGNIKGSALAKGKPINVINFDAHSDFRSLEGRHSGNGFSYAFEEGFLSKYFIFGLHENYTSKTVLDALKKIENRVKFNTYDEIKIRKQKMFEAEMFEAFEFIKDNYYGLEIDLDAVINIPSSAMTISGFSVEELRQFICHFGKYKNACYLHICEGAPELAEDKNNHLVGKLIAYLVSDFLKANHDCHIKKSDITDKKAV